jgi:hypothetical protein
MGSVLTDGQHSTDEFQKQIGVERAKQAWGDLRVVLVYDR